jgi:hypothetical protein
MAHIKMLNFRDEVLDKKEKGIKAMHKPIMFKKEYKIEKIEDVLHVLFNNSASNDTVYADTKGKHCEGGRGRSYYDAYMLCMHYLPKVSFKDMYHTLKKYVDPQHELWASQRSWYYLQSPFWTCPAIGRARWGNQYKIKFK